MKKYLLCALAVLSSTSALSQDSVTSKDVNARLNVPGLFVGWVGGAVDYKVANAVAVGPTAKFFAYGPNKGFEVGVEGAYAMNGDVRSTGWLLKPFASYYKSNLQNKKMRKSVFAGTNLAYQWMWDNGMNTQAAIGVAYSTVKTPLGIGGNRHLTPNFDVSVGYAF